MTTECGQTGKAVKGATMRTAKGSRRLWRLLAVGFILAAVFVPAAAWATDSQPTYPTTATSQVSPTDGPQVKAESASTGSSSLPVTGGDIAGLVAIGGGLVVAGVVLRRARVRRDSV
jgi:hypothetical protein